LPLFAFTLVAANFPALIFLGIYHPVRWRLRPDAPARTLHRSDAVSVLIPFWLWLALAECTHLTPEKSLANLAEPIYCGWFFSALLAYRLGFALGEKRLHTSRWGYVTMSATLVAIVLLALLVPTLPE